MPGSKTYTSNKVNELLEAEFIDSINDLGKHRLKSISSTLFWEIIKISISLLVTTLINLLVMTPKEDSTNLSSNLSLELKTIAVCIFVFILIYLVINGLAICTKWLFDALFNKRLFPFEKKNGYLKFHKKIVNHIYLGISFENKYNMYVSNASNKNDDLNLDLATNYLSQSVHYFKIAKGELHELIPEKSIGIIEKRNAEFLDFIGYPLINVSLISVQRSLNRLIATEKKICNLVTEITAKANEGVIKQAYLTSLINLFVETKSYVGEYEAYLERVIALQNHIESYNKQNSN